MALELSSSGNARYQAVRHADMMTDSLLGTKAITSICAQLMHKHTKSTQIACIVQHIRHIDDQHRPWVLPPFLALALLLPPFLPFVFSNLTLHLLSLTSMFPLRKETEA